MNTQNTQRIINACPSMFETVNGDLAFYFECHDGWADLLVDLCTKIQSHISTLSEDVAKDIVVLQVKEKYGTLRFYLSVYDKTLDALIQDAETKSASICESCGSHGKLRGKVWLYTACDEHTRKEDLDTKAIPDLP